MIIVGHRGARQEAPENTVAGFVHAQANGCEYFELDIQLSSDHELMVFHDTGLKRTTGIRGKLGDKSADYLQGLDARLNTPYWGAPCHIPTLQNVVDSAPHVKHWQFEVKTDSRHKLSVLTKKLARFIHHNSLLERVAVTSGDRWFLAHINKYAPEIDLGYVAEYPFPDPIKTAEKLNCSYLCINDRLVNEKRVKEAELKNLRVSVWTVNSLERMKELAAFNVESIITDIPTNALKHFNSL